MKHGPLLAAATVAAAAALAGAAPSFAQDSAGEVTLQVLDSVADAGRVLRELDSRTAAEGESAEPRAGASAERAPPQASSRERASVFAGERDFVHEERLEDYNLAE